MSAWSCRVADRAFEPVRVLAQQPRVHGVKDRRPHPASDRLAEQVGEPQAQLPGHSDAEGDGENLRRSRPAGGQQVGRPVGQGAGLAGAGSGEQQQRAAAVGDGPGLFGRQPGEQVFGPGRRVAARLGNGCGICHLLGLVR
jgi:hypothetical protein